MGHGKKESFRELLFPKINYHSGTMQIGGAKRSASVHINVELEVFQEAPGPPFSGQERLQSGIPVQYWRLLINGHDETSVDLK
jgi:hypothetical protein